MMLRLAKPLNYVAVSPSVKQRANMRAPETLPLIMEPQSRYVFFSYYIFLYQTHLGEPKCLIFYLYYNFVIYSFIVNGM